MGRNEAKLEVLDLALGYEKRGLAFYLKAADKSRHPLSKRLFYQLSKEEIEHIIRFEDIYREIEKGAAFPQSILPGSVIKGDLKKFFTGLGKKELAPEKDNVAGYQTALQLEQKSYDLYKDLAKETANDNERKFYQGLMQEEQNHFVALKNVYNYLTASEDWAHLEERKVWNWMNL